MSVAQGVYRSRWGFHPCDRATWKAIKRLRFLWFLTVRRVAAWQRWKNKLPHNRIIWRRLRDAQRRPVGWEKVGIWPEPAVPEFMVIEKEGQRVVGQGWIDTCYRQAKRPSEQPPEPFPAERLSEIESLLEQLETWYAGARLR